MLTPLNNANKPPVSDAATALVGGSSANKDTTSANGTGAPASDPDQTATARGPAVLITLSSTAQTNLAVRLQALNTMPADTAQALSDQLQKSKNTLTTLDEAKKSAAIDRKAEAEQKLEQARKKLQLLQMLGGDPATMAKQAKAIGKELTDAANEYSSALKVEAGGNATATNANAANATADDTAAAIGSTSLAPDAKSAARATQAADKLANSTAPATSAPAATGTTAAASDPSSNGVRNASAGVTAAGTSAPQSEADKAAAKATQYKLGQHDRDVLASFKDAAGQVKRVMEEAAHNLKAKNKSGPDARGTVQGGADLDKAVQNLSDTIQIKQDGGTFDTTGTDILA